MCASGKRGGGRGKSRFSAEWGTRCGTRSQSPGIMTGPKGRFLVD